MKMLTPPEVAKQLRIDASKVIGWIRSGQLPAVNVSDGERPRFRIDAADLQRFLDGRFSKSPMPRPRKQQRKNTGNFF